MTKHPDAQHPATSTAPPSSLATNRELPIVAASAIPAVPEGFQFTPHPVRRQHLRLTAEAEQAEITLSLNEVTANAATLRQDLGDMAPDPAPAAVLAKRIAATDAALARANALVGYLTELREIAASDSIQLLESAHRELDHRIDRLPHLEQRYPNLRKVFASRAAAIATGIARAKATTVKEPG